MSGRYIDIEWLMRAGQFKCILGLRPLRAVCSMMEENGVGGDGASDVYIYIYNLFSKICRRWDYRRRRVAFRRRLASADKSDNSDVCGGLLNSEHYLDADDPIV